MNLLLLAFLAFPPTVNIGDTVNFLPAHSMIASRAIADSNLYYSQIGKDHACLYYKGNKTLNSITFASTFLAFAGIIPATITHFNKKIREKNLNYPNAVLWKNKSYKEAYIKQALKIRRKGVWKEFGNVVLIYITLACVSALVWSFITNPWVTLLTLLQSLGST